MTRHRKAVGRLASPVLLGLILGTVVTEAAAQTQPAACFSKEPKDWPSPAKPYFLLAVDGSGSMTSSAEPSTCKVAHGFPSDYPNNRLGMARCSITKTIRAYAGQVSFGLMTFAMSIEPGSSPSTICPHDGKGYNCRINYVGTNYCGLLDGDVVNPNAPNKNAKTRRGGLMLVPIRKDNGLPVSLADQADLLAWNDNNCSDCREIPAYTNTPLDGVLNDAYRYLLRGINKPLDPPLQTPYVYPSPLVGDTSACRSVNVILITDGEQVCGDGSGTRDVQAIARRLFEEGVKPDADGPTWKVPVHVIDIGGTASTNNAIALAGGTKSAKPASNETELSKALSDIIASAIKPEVCNNEDDDCNGCVDEGYKHYCSRNRTSVANPKNASQCCDGSTPAKRKACIERFKASITDANPSGDGWLLPCYTPPNTQLDMALQNTKEWLCYNPGDHCDEQFVGGSWVGLDNNCEGETPNKSVANENALMCAGRCPQQEVCDGVDNDCNQVIDEVAGGAAYSLPGCVKCVPSPEVCDNVDNDCDKKVDEDLVGGSCGPGTPGCVGKLECKKGKWECTGLKNQPEICDGIDNNCNGAIDEGIELECAVQPGLVYNDKSICKKGKKSCNGPCVGAVGPQTEVCNGLDDDCDGQVDEGHLPGVGQSCQAECGAGVLKCEHGVIRCAGVVSPQPEICDGIDNDCNGAIDDGALGDAPSPAQAPCWNLPADSSCATPCSVKLGAHTISWCAPAGGECHGMGTMIAPCRLGTLACEASKWVCRGSTVPSTEICDGVDNNCNGRVDDGLPDQTIGSDVGECKSCKVQCVDGKEECPGLVGPQPEVCDGKDNDCDGQIDNGVAVDEPCTPDYDRDKYPGRRDQGECRKGLLACSDGASVCNGGLGPQPEICDGLDNDCDGLVDEAGVAPDGINGSAHPTDSTMVIGGNCGSDVGACQPGSWACVAGLFRCVGGVGPSAEVCDCQDNDCDGEVDEVPDGPSTTALCGPDKACVKYKDNCQCAASCSGGEFPCWTGYVCERVDYSNNSEPAGARCVFDGCRKCETNTVMTGTVIECGPPGTTTENGSPVPVCQCKQNACHSPCWGVVCEAPLVCAEFGAIAGTCVESTCWNVPCAAGRVCKDGQCVENPCKKGVCQDNEVCRPTDNFTGYVCEASCAGVTCQTGEVCKAGKCVPLPCGGCEPGKVCDGTNCVISKCDENTCKDLRYCDSLTGQCVNSPCDGVLCPAGQQCQDGECAQGAGGAGGAGGSAGAGGDAGDAGIAGQGGRVDASVDGATDTDAEELPRGNWGLATGGGGCGCHTGVKDPSKTGLAAILLLALSLLRRRRTGRQSAIEGGRR